MTSPPRPPSPGTGLDLVGAGGFRASWGLAGPTVPQAQPRPAAGWPCQSPALDSSHGGLRGWETVPYLKCPLCPAGHRREGEGRVGRSCIYLVFIHFYLVPGKGMRARVLGNFPGLLLGLTLAKKSSMVAVACVVCVCVCERGRVRVCECVSV